MEAKKEEGKFEVMLEAEDLYKTYRMGAVEVHAVQEVSLKIAAGEFVAIMGPSGSGKSTLLYLLGFLDTPDRGTIRLFGKDVTSLSEAGFAYLRNRVVGFVFQQFNLLARTTTLENVSLPLVYSDEDAGQIDDWPRELLEKVGLGDRMNHRPNELSGGEQQRVAIARALVNRPRIIFADEPTGNLDSGSQEEVMAVLKKLHSEGMTVVIVTHEEGVAQHASRIIGIHDGRITSDEPRRSVPVGAPGPDKPPPRMAKKMNYTLKEFKEHLRQAARMILSNKVRSCLSMLGVLIGVGCVIAMLALGRGAQESITAQLSRMGSNLLSVRPGSHRVRGVALEAGTVTRLTLEDARAIGETISVVKRAAPQVFGQGQLVQGNKNWNTRIVGATPPYAPMRNQVPAMGRFFTDAENQSRRRVAVIGQTVVHELFGEDNPIGKTIKLNRINFQVIGVLPERGASHWRDSDDLVIIPLLTAMRRVLGKDYLNRIDVEITELDDMEYAEEEIRSLLMRRHRIPEDRVEDSLTVRNYAEIQEALAGTTKTFSILLGAVAAISLIVGGIGIMNVMLVSVTERTREIGLRKAVGATRRDIMTQFLVEAVAITFIGGMMGIVLGWSVSWLLTQIAGWQTVVGLSSILLAFSFSVTVGILFGLWPAKKAARLDPITALRYE